MIIFLIVGTLIFLLGIFIQVSQIQFKRKAIKTTGRIVGFETYQSKNKKSSGETTMYNPVVEFEHGQSYRFISSVSSGAMGYEIDQEVEVYFDPDEPTNAKMERPANNWMGIFIMLFGGLFMGIAITKMEWTLSGFKFEFLMLSPFLLFALFRFFKKKTPEQIEAKRARKSEFKKRIAERQGAVVTEKDLDNDDLFSESNPRDGVLGYQPSEHMISSVSLAETIKEKQKTPTWAKVLILVIGLGLLGGGGYWTKTRYDFIQSAEQATGTIIRFETHRSDGKTMYAPVVKYQAQDGNNYQFKSKVSSSSRSYARGENVTVFYNTLEPNEGLIDKGWLNWLFPGILAFIGLVLTFAGLKGLRKLSKPREI